MIGILMTLTISMQLELYSYHFDTVIVMLIGIMYSIS